MRVKLLIDSVLAQDCSGVLDQAVNIAKDLEDLDCKLTIGVEGQLAELLGWDGTRTGTVWYSGGEQFVRTFVSTEVFRAWVEEARTFLYTHAVEMDPAPISAIGINVKSGLDRSFDANEFTLKHRLRIASTAALCSHNGDLWIFGKYFA